MSQTLLECVTTLTSARDGPIPGSFPCERLRRPYKPATRVIRALFGFYAHGRNCQSCARTVYCSVVTPRAADSRALQAAFVVASSKSARSLLRPRGLLSARERRFETRDALFKLPNIRVRFARSWRYCGHIPVSSTAVSHHQEFLLSVGPPTLAVCALPRRLRRATARSVTAFSSSASSCCRPMRQFLIVSSSQHARVKPSFPSRPLLTSK